MVTDANAKHFTCGETQIRIKYQPLTKQAYMGYMQDSVEGQHYLQQQQKLATQT